MTIYYSLTFVLLAAEMVTFCLLVAPFPYQVRKKLFKFLAESPVVAKIAYALKISFIFVAILFADALQRMFRVTAESDLAKSGQNDVRIETNLAARKFYSQRNTYLTGFTLFLSLVLTRTFYIIMDLIHTQEEYAKLKKAQSKGDDASKEIAELKKKLAEEQAKSRDFETLKKQSSQQAAEYDRLATDYNKATGSVSDKRKD
ncbi:putative endoplasmic reticulum protein [Lyophyllum shimeji]|uniref:Endoplasmic reticulum transmembrane protein n=1 Tax=Lyophyllum shimeji TaxID=47721 RepID=A0A9P3UQP2_LYOSH|nr:putative endoplasmic reticulum protein [Lyophyllum shimeji]